MSSNIPSATVDAKGILPNHEEEVRDDYEKEKIERRYISNIRISSWTATDVI
jgi:hypothetical protein